LTEISLLRDTLTPSVSAVDSTEGQINDALGSSEQELIESYNISDEQEKCSDCLPLITYLRDGNVPVYNDALARKIVIQSDYYVYEDNILYHLHSSRRKRLNQVDPVIKQMFVPRSLRE